MRGCFVDHCSVSLSGSPTKTLLFAGMSLSERPAVSASSLGPPSGEGRAPAARNAIATAWNIMTEVLSPPSSGGPGRRGARACPGCEGKAGERACHSAQYAQLSVRHGPAHKVVVEVCPPDAAHDAAILVVQAEFVKYFVPDIASHEVRRKVAARRWSVFIKIT